MGNHQVPLSLHPPPGGHTLIIVVLESLSWAENSRNQIGPDIPNCGCEGPYVKGPPRKATAEQSRSSKSLQAKVGDDPSGSGSHLCVDTYLTLVAFLLPQT